MASIVRNSAITVAGMVCSRAFGFVRDAALAWLFGSSLTADALTTALRLPYVARRLYGEGALSLELTTLFSFARQRTPHADVPLARGIGIRLALCGCILFACAYCFAVPLMQAITPGFEGASPFINEAASYFQLAVGYVPVVLLAAVCMAFLQGRESFAIPALSGTVFNSVLIACIAFAALNVGSPGHIVAFGVFLGGLAQWLVQMPASYALARLAPVQEPAGPAQLCRVLVRLPFGFIGAAMPQLSFLIAAGLTSFHTDGSLAALFYAERLLEFPLGIFGGALGMVAAPMLARSVAREGGLNRPLQKSLEVCLLGTLPAAAGLMAVALPATAVLFGHGAFGDDAVRMTASYIVAYAPALPAYAASRPLLASCHALESRSLPLLATVVGLGVTVLGGYALVPYCAQQAPPFGASLGIWVYAGILWLGVRYRTGCFTPALHRICVAGLGSGAVYWVATFFVERASQAFIALATAIPAGIGVYVCFVMLDAPLRRSCRHLFAGWNTK